MSSNITTITYGSRVPFIKKFMYDYGQYVLIKNLEIKDDARVCLSNSGDEKAFSVTPTISSDGILVGIPNVLFESDSTITGYIENHTTKSSTVLDLFEIRLHKRSKPQDFISSEEAVSNPNIQEYKALVATEQKGLATYAQSLADEMEEELQAGVNATVGTVVSNKNLVVKEAENVRTYKSQVQQTMSDFLAMMGEDVATLTNGKLTPSQIPDISINKSFKVNSESELVKLDAQTGDMAYQEDSKGEVIALWWLSAGVASAMLNWKKLGLSFVPNAGHATTSDTATNATKINGKRIVGMTADQYANAVKDNSTFYFVTGI